MKCQKWLFYAVLTLVAPHAGAWIEIRIVAESLRNVAKVAPHAGAWIEIVH